MSYTVSRKAFFFFLISLGQVPIYNVFESSLNIRKNFLSLSVSPLLMLPLGPDKQKIVSGSQRQEYSEHFVILSPASSVLHKFISKCAVFPVMQDTWTCWSSVAI